MNNISDYIFPEYVFSGIVGDGVKNIEELMIVLNEYNMFEKIRQLVSPDVKFAYILLQDSSIILEIDVLGDNNPNSKVYVLFWVSGDNCLYGKKYGILGDNFSRMVIPDSVINDIREIFRSYYLDIDSIKLLLEINR